MNKNYVIAFLVVIVAAGAFFYFRDRQGSEETQKLRSEAFVKLTDISKKVPRTGLTQMAAALERYHKKNNKYPAQLEELYPEYMPYQQFIDEIEWYYEPRGDNFFLSKTVIQGKKQVVASIDKSMNPQVGSGMEVAAVSKKDKAKKADDAAEETSPVLALKPIETIQPIEPLAMETPEPESIIEQPEVVSMVAGEIGHGIASDISQKLLVWRDKNGVLGFGNVIYPKTRNLTIYRDGNWINIKNPEPKEDPPASVPTKDSSGSKNKSVAIATDYSNKFLVWKDKKGNIGYGNVQYPSIDNIAYICVNGNWQKVVN